MDPDRLLCTAVKSTTMHVRGFEKNSQRVIKTMAAQLCNSLLARLDSLPDDEPCVLYVVAGVKASLAVSAKTVPFMSPENSEKYRQIYIIFGDGRDDPGAETVAHNASQIVPRKNGIVAVTPSPLPLDDPSFYAIPGETPGETPGGGGPLGRDA